MAADTHHRKKQRGAKKWRHAAGDAESHRSCVPLGYTAAARRHAAGGLRSSSPQRNYAQHYAQHYAVMRSQPWRTAAFIFSQVEAPPLLRVSQPDFMSGSTSSHARPWYFASRAMLEP